MCTSLKAAPVKPPPESPKPLPVKKAEPVVKPVQFKPTAPKPAEFKPAPVKPVEFKPVPEQVELKPAPKPAPVKPVEFKPVPKPAPVKMAPKPAPPKPVEFKPKPVVQQTAPQPVAPKYEATRPDQAPRFLNDLLPQPLKLGQTAYFECTVDAWPYAEILWTRKGHPLGDKTRFVQKYLIFVYQILFDFKSNSFHISHRNIFSLPKVYIYIIY